MANYGWSCCKSRHAISRSPSIGSWDGSMVSGCQSFPHTPAYSWIMSECPQSRHSDPRLTYWKPTSRDTGGTRDTGGFPRLMQFDFKFDMGNGAKLESPHIGTRSLRIFACSCFLIKPPRPHRPKPRLSEGGRRVALRARLSLRESRRPCARAAWEAKMKVSL